MSNRRTFLKNISLLTLGGLASRQALAAPSNTLSTNASAPVSMGTNAKQMGLQTYSLGQELLKDLPNGLQRLAKMGFTELEIFGYREDTGKFGDYNPQNTLFISPKEYKKMADDAGLKITSSHLTPSVRDYIPENMSKFEDFWKKATDIHAELGCKYMVQPSLPRIENEDDAKRVCDVFNKAGEITSQAGILWGYHNHNREFERVLKAGEKKAERPNRRAPQGTYIEELFMKNTDPKKVLAYQGPLDIGRIGHDELPEHLQEGIRNWYLGIFRGTGRRPERTYAVRRRGSQCEIFAECFFREINKKR